MNKTSPNLTGSGSSDRDPYLGRALKVGREKRGLSQVDLAKSLGIKSPAISNFETGQRLPSLVQLSQLAATLDLDLPSLILCRAYDEVYALDLGNWPEKLLKQRPGLLGGLQRCIHEAESAASVKVLEHLKGRSILEFPEAFPNIRIVTGDKREYPPKTAGDIGAYSASPIDDRWIYRLNLPKTTEKVSDKEFVISSEDRLREEYGNCTLLVIGSPASNHLARKINSSAIFRFNLQKGFREILQDVLQDLTLEKYGEVPEHRKSEHLKDLKRMMTRFYAFGIIDPLYAEGVRGYALRGDIDYGTITFAANPYYQGDDFRYVAIMVAGFHHPATVWALRCLGEPRSEENGFLKHPYGGIIKVEIDTELSWEERMRKAKCFWDTDEYDQKSLLEGLDRFKNYRSSLMHIEPEEVEKCKGLLMAL
jgi:transcriptional regulator with XRE-family HTH domain